MGKWLDKFPTDIPDSRTDIPDRLCESGTMSALSVRDMDVSAKIIPSDSADEPPPPLQAGWRIGYMDHEWKLAGGCDDAEQGTVRECRWADGAGTVILTDGQIIPLSRVRSVGAVDHKGRLYGAWTVREHGYDGEQGALMNRAAWRELATLTSGLTREDPRLPAVLDALLECQQAEDEGDGKAFHHCAERIRRAVEGTKIHGEA